MSGKHRNGPGSRRGLSGRARALTTAAAALALIFSAVALVFRFQPVTSIPRLVLAVGATFVPFIALTGLALAVMSRRVVLTIIGGFLVIATVAIQLSWYYIGRSHDPGRHTEIRVFASNIRVGQAHTESFVALTADADVVTVAELTADAVDRFAQAGLNERFPFSLLDPRPGAGGIGLWSRYPIRQVSAQPRFNVSISAARMRIPGVKFDPLVASMHIMSPFADDENTIDQWRYGMAGAKAQLDTFAQAAGPGAVIVGGDYNSTPDMRQFRDLLTNGYQDAVQQTGSGFAPTFRTDGAIPPVITIDHVLTRNAVASSIRTVTVKGSDHRALLATIKVPLDPTS